LAAICITMILALSSGFVVGKILNTSLFEKQHLLFDDAQFFEGLESDEDTSHLNHEDNLKEEVNIDWNN